MKIILRNLCALVVLTFGINPAQATDTNQPTSFRLTVELRDGSKLIGKAGDENYQFRSDVLGEMKLPLEKIRSIEWQAKTNSVKLTTPSGDALSAQFAIREIRVETAFGNVKLPASLLKQIQVSPMGKPAKMRPGLVALWSGEGNGSDSVGGNDATLTDVSFADGQVGSAFSLNGFRSYLNIPYNLSLNLAEGAGFTITAWIKPSDVIGIHPLLSWSDPGANIGVVLRTGHQPGDSGVIEGDFTDVDDQCALISPQGMVASGSWQHIAMTYDKASGKSSIYLNGFVVAQGQQSHPFPFGSLACDICLGQFPGSAPGSWSYNRFFAGLLDEVALYNHALSTEEIKAIAVDENHGEPLSPPTLIMKRSGFFNGNSRHIDN